MGASGGGAAPPGVAAVLLAAGRSRRFGGPRPKQLVEVEGEPLVRRLARRLLATEVDEVIVVVGYRAEEVAAAISDLPLRIVDNRAWEEGQSRSLRQGLAAVSPSSAAAVITLCDQPLVTAALIDRLVAAYRRRGSPVVAATWQGEPRPPVLFDRGLFAELGSLRGDVGARHLVRRRAADLEGVPAEEPRQLDDADTEAELAALLVSKEETRAGPGVDRPGR